MKKVQAEPFHVIGISVRTTNEHQQGVKDIGEFVELVFFSENVAGNIPNKTNADIYAIYTDYEGDFTKPYTTIIGCRVQHLDDIPEGMTARSFEGGNYLHLTARGNLHNGLVECSYVNAAISSRLETNPQRIFWSGLQTYSDVIRLVYAIRKGQISSISSRATFDLFGYSIGSFLSMILLMANPKGIFTHSKLFCFCGGMTIDRMYPISRYIMDSRAAIAMQKSFTELLSTDFANDPRLAHYQNSDNHKNESWFKTMLRYNFYQEDREKRIRELQHQIKSLVLKQDRVTPPIEALNTLKGGYRDIQ
ncbi:hypothetical protein ANCCEY_15253, partial [Ancylostoma ceylanicum]